ncbi:hypothetical protein DSECCO2_502560 [anaerobic digester metagenome]
MEPAHAEHAFFGVVFVQAHDFVGREHDGWNEASVLIADDGVVFQHDVQDGFVVGRIGVVPMPEPVAAAKVNFGIAGQVLPVDDDFGVFEIRAVAVASFSGFQNTAIIAGVKDELLSGKSFFPDIMNERFRYIHIWHSFASLNVAFESND